MAGLVRQGSAAEADPVVPQGGSRGLLHMSLLQPRRVAMVTAEVHECVSPGMHTLSASADLMPARAPLAKVRHVVESRPQGEGLDTAPFAVCHTTQAALVKYFGYCSEPHV